MRIFLKLMPLFLAGTAAASVVVGAAETPSMDPFCAS